MPIAIGDIDFNINMSGNSKTYELGEYSDGYYVKFYINHSGYNNAQGNTFTITMKRDMKADIFLIGSGCNMPAHGTSGTIPATGGGAGGKYVNVRNVTLTASTQYTIRTGILADGNNAEAPSGISGGGQSVDTDGGIRASLASLPYGDSNRGIFPFDGDIAPFKNNRVGGSGSGGGPGASQNTSPLPGGINYDGGGKGGDGYYTSGGNTIRGLRGLAGSPGTGGGCGGSGDSMISVYPPDVETTLQYYGGSGLVIIRTYHDPNPTIPINISYGTPYAGESITLATSSNPNRIADEIAIAIIEDILLMDIRNLPTKHASILTACIQAVMQGGAFYDLKYHEVNKYQHKRALALTARKLIRLPASS
ncbi:hypothetical protein AGMMS49992_32900 [Clostridia bacterium]|nr:hypothetical protein AGMMS49992_32900 [Clostridia bacterium]